MYVNTSDMFPDITGRVASMTMMCQCSNVPAGGSCYSLMTETVLTLFDTQLDTSGNPINKTAAAVSHYDIVLPAADPAGADPTYNSTGSYCQGGSSCSLGYPTLLPQYNQQGLTWGNAMRAMRVGKVEAGGGSGGGWGG